MYILYAEGGKLESNVSYILDLECMRCEVKLPNKKAFVLRQKMIQGIFLMNWIEIFDAGNLLC